MEFFVGIENSGFATWVREGLSFWAFEIFLVSHALGMAALVGLNAAIDLRILGFAPRAPLQPFESFFPLMWAGFWVNLVSGVVLFVAYPVKAVTNPGFYIKMSGVVLAVWLLRRIRREVFGSLVGRDTRSLPANAKTVAGASLFLWLVAIVAGRLMAYHNTGVGLEWKTPLVMVIATILMVLGAYGVSRLWGQSEPSRVDA